MTAIFITSLEDLAGRTILIARWLILLSLFVVANWAIWILLVEWIR